MRDKDFSLTEVLRCGSTLPSANYLPLNLLKHMGLGVTFAQETFHRYYMLIWFGFFFFPLRIEQMFAAFWKFLSSLPPSLPLFFSPCPSSWGKPCCVMSIVPTLCFQSRASPQDMHLPSGTPSPECLVSRSGFLHPFAGCVPPSRPQLLEHPLSPPI